MSESTLELISKVTEFNGTLEDEPELVNTDPYGAGWMIKVKLSDPKEIENLLDATAYTTLVTG